MRITWESKTSHFAAPALALFLALAGQNALAQEDNKAANLLDDIRYARDLARYRYFDLAVEWLADIDRAGGLDEGSRIEVSLAKATISRLASVHALTREGRKGYYDEAVKHYHEAIDKMAGGMTAAKGDAVVEGLASVLVSKGEFYTEELDRLRAEEAAADVIQQHRTVADESFREAVKTLNGVYGDLSAAAGEATTEEDQKEIGGLALDALYRKGEALYLWALLYEAKDFNREDYLNKCIGALTDYVWEAGDDSIFALYAWYYQGVAEWELGQIPTSEAAAHDFKALSFLTQICSEESVKFDELPNLMDDERVFVLGLVERSYGAVCRLYRAAAKRIETSAAGDAEDMTDAARGYGVLGDESWMVKAPVFKGALAGALRQAGVTAVSVLEKRTSAAGLELSAFGFRALLEKARTQRDAGNLPDAVLVVKDVAERNEGNVVGLEAQTLLAELIGGGDETAQPPAVLRIAVDGLLAESRWLDAIRSLHSLVATCRADEDKAKYLAAAWNDIGGCYQSASRNLEAALAYEAGFQAAKELKDDVAAGDLALNAYNAWDRRFRETKHDFDKAERNRVRNIVTELGISADVQFLVGREAFSNAAGTKDPEESKKAFGKAVEELDKVEKDSNYYERALVYRARALAGAGQPKEAVAGFDQLLKRIEEVDVSLDKKKVSQRAFAQAEAVYYRSGVLLDLMEFAEVFRSLEGYEEKFEAQNAYFPNICFYRVRAKVGLKEIEAAEALLTQMESLYAKHQCVTYAINELANGHYASYQAVADKASEPAKAHLQKAAGFLARVNQINDYPSFGNLESVADWYGTIGQWELSAENYGRLFQKFGKDPAREQDLNKRARRRYAEALLELRRFPDALPLWSEEYKVNSKDRITVRAYAMCLGGWLEDKEVDGVVEYTEVPGAGQYEEAMRKWLELKEGIEDANDKGSANWWECMSNFLYCQYMLSKTDPQQKAAALKLINNWKALHPKLGGEPFDRRIKRLERALSK
ncbi:MAG: hypothetical protein HY812_08220 [Planctomycetes bacterium]|nr:hypothetical protein [Planctomycetota bacterium]